MTFALTLQLVSSSFTPYHSNEPAGNGTSNGPSLNQSITTGRYSLYVLQMTSLNSGFFADCCIGTPRWVAASTACVIPPLMMRMTVGFWSVTMFIRRDRSESRLPPPEARTFEWSTETKFVVQHNSKSQLKSTDERGIRCRKQRAAREAALYNE